jgi:hypothetical protein
VKNRVLKSFEKFTVEQAKQLEIDKKTYLKYLKRNVVVPEDYQEIINDIKSYDISNFSYNDKPYDFWIKPDNNFLGLLKQLNTYISDKISEDILFEFTYDAYNLNRIEFKKGIPNILQKTGLGYKLYCFVINKIEFALSDKDASAKAVHIWRNLILDDNFYSFTSNDISGVILKKNSNLKMILDNIKKYDSNVIDFNFDEIIFDEELEQKIIEIYGSMVTYKQ